MATRRRTSDECFPSGDTGYSGNVLLASSSIYAGFVAMCAGVSMIAASAAGLWLVTPTVLLACTGLVLGYERLDLKRRFGDTPHLLPADDTTLPRVGTASASYSWLSFPG